eukprot:2516949-Amphidinium_carterae.1
MLPRPVPSRGSLNGKVLGALWPRAGWGCSRETCGENLLGCRQVASGHHVVMYVILDPHTPDFLGGCVTSGVKAPFHTVIVSLRQVVSSHVPECHRQ